MEQKIKELVAELLNLNEEQITNSLSMQEVEVWDSLRHMELIVSIEEKFGIELTFDEITSMQTFGDITNVLRARDLE